MAIMLNGIGVSRGIGIGHVHIFNREKVEIREHKLEKRQLAAEIKRFRAAVDQAKSDLAELRQSIPQDAPAEVSAFIETHLLMLDDETLSERPIEILKNARCNAEWALKQQREAILDVFEAMDDPYIKTRTDDVNHVIDLILVALQKQPKRKIDEGLDWRGAIVVADDLSPADTVNMQHQGIAGFITEMGGQLSHTAILSRSLGIPAIVGLHEARRYLKEGDEIIINGSDGITLTAIDETIVQHYKKKQRTQKRKQKELQKLRDAPAQTLCGTPIQLLANIEVEEDFRSLKRQNPAGVGLYRTEFLYLNRETAPDEEEHFRTYLKVIRALKGAPLTIRTVDLGADKEMLNNPRQTPAGYNPALGLRGIRRCLNDHQLLIPQLRAIYRAAQKGPIKIMFPMLTNVQEIHQLRLLILQVKDSLRAGGYKIESEPEIGGMVEVPAAAIAASQFASALQFLSIGTNDLIQYTLAIDRVDDQINYLYDPLHPAVLTLIQNVIMAGENAKIPVSMCGEMAGDTRYTRLLLGLGLREFSMPLNSMLEVKNIINHSDIQQARKITTAIMHSDNQEQQLELLETLNAMPNTQEQGEKV